MFSKEPMNASRFAVVYLLYLHSSSTSNLLSPFFWPLKRAQDKEIILCVACANRIQCLTEWGKKNAWSVSVSPLVHTFAMPVCVCLSWSMDHFSNIWPKTEEKTKKKWNTTNNNSDLTINISPCSPRASHNFEQFTSISVNQIVDSAQVPAHRSKADCRNERGTTKRRMKRKKKESIFFARRNAHGQT